ncbi:MAG TPA: EamA family transporter [Actinoplanes sp.]|nr:EamA family transporter [Actinoplanes sp.]
MFSSYLNDVFGRARLSLLQVSITGILWGTTGVVVQVVAERTGLGALAIGFYRLAFAAVVLLAVGFPARRRIVAAFRAAPVGVVATGVGLASYQALYFLAVRLGGVSIATVVSLGVAPVLLSAWESLRERRRPGTPMIIAAAAAIIGLMLIAYATADPSATDAGAGAGTTAQADGGPSAGTQTGGELPVANQAGDELPAASQAGGELPAAAQTSGELPAASQAGGGPPAAAQTSGELPATAQTGGGPPATAGLGLLVAIASGIVYAASTAVSRHTTQGVEPLHLTTLACVIGAVTILPVAAVEGLGFTPGVEPIALLVYAGAITTALAYALFYMGLRHISGSVAVVVTLLEPLTAALLAVLLIDEPLGVATIIGGILLMAAVGTLYLNAGETSQQRTEVAGTHG